MKNMMNQQRVGHSDFNKVNLFNIPRLVRGIHEIYVKTLSLADKPRGVGRDVIKRQLQARNYALC